MCAKSMGLRKAWIYIRQWLTIFTFYPEKVRDGWFAVRRPHSVIYALTILQAVPHYRLGTICTIIK